MPGVKKSGTLGHSDGAGQFVWRMQKGQHFEMKVEGTFYIDGEGEFIVVTAKDSTRQNDLNF